MKKVISLVFIMVFVVTSLNSYCMAFDSDSSEFDFNSVINDSFIKTHGSYIGDGGQNRGFFSLMAEKNKKLANKTAEEIVKGNIKLDKNISPNADLTEAILKKIYDKDNIDYFKKELEDHLLKAKNNRIQELKEEGLENEVPRIEKLFDDIRNDYLTFWWCKSPVLMGIVNTDIITYLIHTNPESKEVIKNLKEIEQEVRTGVELYIDNMGLTDATKESMKKTLRDVKVYYYGITNNFDFCFDNINKKELMKNIESDNETFFKSLSNYSTKSVYDGDREKGVAGTVFADETRIYQPNASTLMTTNEIIVYPAIFLCTDSDEKSNLELMIRMTLSHEFGHLWNSNYIKKNLLSYGEVTCRDHKSNFKTFEEYLENWGKEFRLKKVCPEDEQELETYAQNIVDKFNNVETGLIYANGEKVKIDGLFVYMEAAADNFALNSVTTFDKEKGKDLSKIFFTFAKYTWGTYTLQDFKVNIYPPAPYRTNIGLKLCKNFDAEKMKVDLLKENINN